MRGREKKKPFTIVLRSLPRSHTRVYAPHKPARMSRNFARRHLDGREAARIKLVPDRQRLDGKLCGCVNCTNVW